MATTLTPDTPSPRTRPIGLTIAGLIVRGIWLVLRRRVSLRRGDAGRTVLMDDGQRFTVFRHAFLAAPGEPAAVFTVRFTPARMGVRLNIWFSVLPMIPLFGMRGFREKYWCVDERTGRCQGIYRWQTRADAEAYAASVALRFMTRRSVPGSVSHQITDQGGGPGWTFEEEGRGGSEMRQGRSRMMGCAVAVVLGVVVALVKHFVGSVSVATTVFDGVLVVVATMIAVEILLALWRGERSARHFFPSWRR